MDVFGSAQTDPPPGARDESVLGGPPLRSPWNLFLAQGASHPWAVRAVWLYTLPAFGVLAALPRDHPFAYWAAYPLQLLVLVLALQVAWRSRRTSRLTSALGWLAALYSVLFAIANYAWNYLRDFDGPPNFNVGDVLYFADYGVLLAFAAVVYVRHGGSFRHARTWLDALTIFTSLCIAFWAVLSGVLVPQVAPSAGSIFTLPYAIAGALLMTMGTLLWIQNARIGRSAPILIALAVLLTASGEFAWLANWLEATDFIGDYYPVIQMIASALLANALALTAETPSEPDATVAALSAQNFLPVLATSLSMALVAGFLGTTRDPAAWLTVVFMVIALLLLLMREDRVRRELAMLRQERARRAADERLTELVRRSSDLIVVGDRRGVIVYASPAAEQIVGVPAEQLLGSPLQRLCGAEHRASLVALVDVLGTGPGRVWESELIQGGEATPERVLKLTGVNQLENPLIAGMVLTIKDITAQRAIERQMLDAVTDERVRLAGDLHDGLGQELTGIAMLLKGVATTPNARTETVKEELQEIIAHLNHAIMGTRGLAHGLAPVKVVDGSLARAVQLLARDIARRHQIEVDVAIEAAADDCLMAEAATDHLYRIAQEALLNAARHGQCRRARLELRIEGQLLRLRVSDDGRGFEHDRITGTGIGLQLMEFRARIIGGRLAVGGRGYPGARVEVTVPLSRIKATPVAVVT